MPKYYRVMLGAKSSAAPELLSSGHIAVDMDIEQDLTGHLAEDWRTFNKEFIPIFLEIRPEKSKIAAGLACGMLWTVAKGMQEGDVILSPDGSGSYHVGTIAGPYVYDPSSPLRHRRPVTWTGTTIAREAMTEPLKRSAGSIATVAEITKHTEELQTLIGGPTPPDLMASDPTVEDPAVFALEKHLEDFLVANWTQTPLGLTHKIYEDDGGQIGQQFPTDTGPIDILAVSHDGSDLLVVELKRGKASDSVVGQVQRYMGYVQDELAEPGQSVHGVIIALDDDQRIRRALSVAPNIDFYRYEVKFTLNKA